MPLSHFHGPTFHAIARDCREERRRRMARMAVPKGEVGSQFQRQRHRQQEQEQEHRGGHKHRQQQLSRSGPKRKPRKNEAEAKDHKPGTEHQTSATAAGDQEQVIVPAATSVNEVGTVANDVVEGDPEVAPKRRRRRR